MDSNLSLVDYLKRMGGMRVQESPNNPLIVVRGMNQRTEKPLFILNGQDTRKDFFVKEIVNPNDIKYAEVL
ncbi:MAG: hypothetical protein QM485_11400 [Flavobacteriaceae bacterium]